MSIVKLENVSRIYKSVDHGQKALDGVDLTLEEGKFVVILGPSGAGKSTLLNLLGGLVLGNALFCVKGDKKAHCLIQAGLTLIGNTLFVNIKTCSKKPDLRFLLHV